jgi:hypothetical protein
VLPFWRRLASWNHPAMPKDRIRRYRLAPDVRVVIQRSSAHPVEYAIMLLVERDGEWHTVRTFDNAHDPTEHHEHRYIGLREAGADHHAWVRERRDARRRSQDQGRLVRYRS